MTKTTQNTPRSPENHNPALGVVNYANHTFHMNRARNYTYNYSFIDGVLMEAYKDHTIKQISEILNESFQRIKYRIRFLQTNHPKTIVFKRGVTVDKGTHKVSDVRQSKRKVKA